MTLNPPLDLFVLFEEIIHGREFIQPRGPSIAICIDPDIQEPDKSAHVRVTLRGLPFAREGGTGNGRGVVGRGGKVTAGRRRQRCRM